MPGGAATKRTEETARLVCEALEAGHTYDAAASFAGIVESSLHLWRSQDPEFSERCRNARRNGKRRLESIVLAAAATDHKHALEILARRYGKAWARKNYDTVRMRGRIKLEAEDIAAIRAEAAQYGPPRED